MYQNRFRPSRPIFQIWVISNFAKFLWSSEYHSKTHFSKYACIIHLNAVYLFSQYRLWWRSGPKGLCILAQTSLWIIIVPTHQYLASSGYNHLFVISSKACWLSISIDDCPNNLCLLVNDLSGFDEKSTWFQHGFDDITNKWL